MPTPRMTSYIATQAGRGTPPLEFGTDGRSPAGEWVGGTVVDVDGFINSTYTVALDNGQSVSAADTGDGGLSVGSRVWVVIADGGSALIVGRQ